MEIEKVKKEMNQLKENIDGAKNNLATLDGREMEILKQLKKVHGLSSIEDIKKKIKEFEKESSLLETSIENDYNKLKEEYDF